MNGIMSWMEKHFIPIAGRIGAQRHLVAIRDGFVAIMPLIIIGAFATLINNLPLPTIETWQENVGRFLGENWTMFGGNIWDATFAIMGLLVTATIAYHLANSYDVDGMSAAVLSLATLIMFTPLTEDWGISMAWVGAQGLFVALINAMVVTELFRLLVKSKFTIKMPAGVPEGVVKSFQALVPMGVILMLFSLIQMGMVLAFESSVHEQVFTLIQQPLTGLSDSLPAALLIVFIQHLLWFFGLHGTNIIGPITDSIYLPLLEQNISQFSAGVSAYDVPHIVTKAMLDAYVYMGGAGVTLGLIIAIFIVAKTSHYRTIGKLGGAGGAFNINEPVLFGLPIVLNPVMLIPFLLIPIILTLTSYFAILIGFVPKTVALLPWTMPPFISGWLVSGGSFAGVVLQIFNLGLAVLMYIPFLRAAERAQQKVENNEAP
ncbi:PTS sugar transporter subunit IIC [Shouchella shacheensis]|uniref:PTS sugar transporter subunit IIC n=1 Tax=Shouchella shacheensis TaxID=1649580 RepID=UPI000B0EE688|nr:PTS sugar transporter subunit IIC [Shouchella shacheensis]